MTKPPVTALKKGKKLPKPSTTALKKKKSIVKVSNNKHKNNIKITIDNSRHSKARQPTNKKPSHPIGGSSGATYNNSIPLIQSQNIPLQTPVSQTIPLQTPVSQNIPSQTPVEQVKPVKSKVKVTKVKVPKVKVPKVKPVKEPKVKTPKEPKVKIPTQEEQEEEYTLPEKPKKNKKKVKIPVEPSRQQTMNDFYNQEDNTYNTLNSQMSASIPTEKPQQLQLTPLGDISRKRDYDKTNLNIFNNLDSDNHIITKGINIPNPLIINKHIDDYSSWFRNQEDRMIPNDDSIYVDYDNNKILPYEDSGQTTNESDRRTTVNLFPKSPEKKRQKISEKNTEFVSPSPATKKKLSRYMTRKLERLERDREMGMEIV